MSDSDVKLGSDLSWQLLKERASTLGIPAWKLAEEYAFHQEENKKHVIKR
tara:strand:+ start:201 stop:350 length:150 start_codon:yes stop_codon:yes gene_type:complete